MAKFLRTVGYGVNKTGKVVHLPVSIYTYENYLILNFKPISTRTGKRQKKKKKPVSPTPEIETAQILKDFSEPELAKQVN